MTPSSYSEYKKLKALQVKSKTYIHEYENYNIIEFYQEETKTMNSGWFFKVVEKF